MMAYFAVWFSWAVGATLVILAAIQYYEAQARKPTWRGQGSMFTMTQLTIVASAITISELSLLALAIMGTVALASRQMPEAYR
jgi:hypothetical protein